LDQPSVRAGAIAKLLSGLIRTLGIEAALMGNSGAAAQAAE
ncbi:MAG TPA: N-formylglutamate amidohydrolase, partial [Erythrobacter sp.]|nr:N-formylglutamate amidohydrolase [Erythrobacter sp.]